MEGKTKRRKVPGELREVLAQNVNRLMEQRYRENSNRPLALAKDAGVSLSSVQRTLSRETGATVDTVESFARVFGLSPYQLLMPGWLGQTVAHIERTPLLRGRDRVASSARARQNRRSG